MVFEMNKQSGTLERIAVPVRLYGMLIGGSLGSISLMLAEDTFSLLLLPGRKTMLPASSILSVSIEQWQTKEDDGNYSY